MKNNKKWGMLALIMMFWFTISFITNILGPLIPDIIHNFELKDLAMAGFIPTSFFLAYAIMSIPAGILIDKYGEKPVLFTGFLMPFIGTVLFACFPFYLILLVSSFIIGLGMAMLQTVINPLQRVVGGEENYAFIAELAQFVFGVASLYQIERETCKQDGSDKWHKETGKQHRLFSIFIYQYACRYRHDGISQEEGSRDKSRHCQILQLKVMDNVRN